jgi:hypothetical protein
MPRRFMARTLVIIAALSFVAPAAPGDEGATRALFSEHLIRDQYWLRLWSCRRETSLTRTSVGGEDRLAQRLDQFPERDR